jgi:hypothetical protein
MIHKVPCPHCRGTLYEIVDPQDAAQKKTSQRAAGAPTGDLLTCQHCGKKLRLLKTVGPHGFPLFTVVGQATETP